MSTQGPASPSLVLVDDEGLERGTTSLAGPEVLLGRELVAELGGGTDPGVSRRHARIYAASSGGWQLEDLGSRAGTLLNGRRVERLERLVSGDAIDVASHRFVFRLGAGGTRGAAELHAESTLVAQRLAAPERLRTAFELGRLVDAALAPPATANRLVEILERTLPGCSAQVVLGAVPPLGVVDPFSPDDLQRRVLGQAEVATFPPQGGKTTAVALPLLPGADPLGLLLVRSTAERPLREDDLHFIALAAALAGEAIRRAQRISSLSAPGPGKQIVGHSPSLQAALREIATVASYADVPVLLLGETGTGKELFARRLHELSGRAGPFVPVNVAAFPAELLDSELFGHAKGSFTGAHAARVGYVELADGGTLFLDEIGEAPAQLQVKLLRVLQEKSIQRVGDVRPIRADIRLVAATNADLRAKIAKKEFREDLYYRIAAKEVRIPPLRERAGDVRELAQTFVARDASARAANLRGVDEAALALLEAHPWVGNVRQLESTMRLAVIHAIAANAREITPDHLDERVRATPGPPPAEAPAALDGGAVDFAGELARAERQVVVRALSKADGNKREAARLLGWSVNTLRERLERYGIQAP